MYGHVMICKYILDRKNKQKAKSVIESTVKVGYVYKNCMAKHMA